MHTQILLVQHGTNNASYLVRTSAMLTLEDKKLPQLREDIIRFIYPSRAEDRVNQPTQLFHIINSSSYGAL